MLKLFVISVILVAAVAGRPGTCPPSSGLAGICVFIEGYNCIRDTECPSGQKCCPEGCGKVCMAVQSAPTAVVDEEHPGSCPPQMPPIFGICRFDPAINCLHDRQCTQAQKCCSSGCNRICKNAVYLP